MAVANIAPSTTDVANSELIQYNITMERDGIETSLGFTDVGTFQFRAVPRMVSKEFDQLAPTIALLYFQGWDVSCDFTLSAASPSFIAETVFDQLVGIRGDSSPYGGAVGLGDKPQTFPTFSLTAVPTGNAAGVYEKSFYIGKAALRPGTEPVWTGSKNDFQSLAIQLVALPDFDESAYFRYALMGNVDADDSDPTWIFLSASNAIAPYKHHTAFSLPVSGVQDTQAWGVWKTNSTITAALNDASDINTTDTSIVYDTLAGGTIPAGSYILMGTEAMYVVSNTTSSATAGTLVVVRSVLGSTAASHLDNAVITRISWYKRNMTHTGEGTWASSSTGHFTVGNTPGSINANRPGRSTWVSNGSGNLNYTIGLTASPATVVTTNSA